MTLEFTTDAISQIIDDSGKSRALTFDYKSVSLTLITPPSPPLDVKITKKIHMVEIGVALAFIKEHLLKIKEQDGNDDNGLRGLWLDGGYYIPITRSVPINDVPFSSPYKNDPLRTDNDSDLETYRKNKKIAEYLKQYTLYTYSMKGSLGKKDFVVIPGHLYDIDSLRKKLTLENTVIYADGKIIVPSKETRDRLLSYLEVEKIHNATALTKIKEKQSLEENYQSIRDFRSSEDQLIFFGKESLMRWRTSSTSVNEVEVRWLPTVVEPYFFKHPDIKNGALLIVQNTDTKERAIAVSYEWMVNKVNNLDAEEIEDVSYIIYDVSGRHQRVSGTTKEKAMIVDYGGGWWGAILTV